MPMMRPLLFAHAFGQRYELPIPLLLFVLGGAAVVFASFLLVLPQKVTAQANEPAGHAPATAFSWQGAAVSLTVLTAVIAAGLFGSQEVPENIVPTLFWLVGWIAVPLSCGVIGDWTKQ